MRGKMVRLSLLVSLLAVLLPVVVAAAPPRNVILIDWDGAGRERVDRCLAQKELPNLQRLIDRGVYVKIDGEGVTDMASPWTPILTGYLPKAAAGSAGSQNPSALKNTSIFDRLENHFGSDQFVTVALIGEQRPQANPQSVPTSVGANPPSEVPPAPEVCEDGLLRDERVGTRAIELLDKYKDKPFLFFVQFTEGRAGENSTEPNAALIAHDLWTGRIMDKVKELQLAEKTQLYVTADRGLNKDKAAEGAVSHLFLATDNRAVYRAGRLQDVAPTILEAFGLDPGKIEPALDGISLTKIDTRPPAGGVNRKPDVIFVPTPEIVVNKMLELAQVKPSDIVYDLGCGDGRIVVTAAKRFGCKAYGYDIDPQRVAESLENVAKNGVGHLVTIEQKDIFTLDLSKADVVTLYLLPSLNVKLIPQLEKLKPGSRIVSHDFDMRGVKPDQVVEVTGDGNYISHTVYFWTCPLHKVEEPDSNSDDGVD